MELAGIIAQLSHHTLFKEFRSIDTRRGKNSPHRSRPANTASFSAELSEYATRTLTKMGVTVLTGNPVTSITDADVTVGQTCIPSKTAIWAAGVQASKVAEWIGTPADRAGRAIVEPDLSVPRHPDFRCR